MISHIEGAENIARTYGFDSVPTGLYDVFITGLQILTDETGVSKWTAGLDFVWEDGIDSIPRADLRDEQSFRTNCIVGTPGPKGGSKPKTDPDYLLRTNVPLPQTLTITKFLGDFNSVTNLWYNYVIVVKEHRNPNERSDEDILKLTQKVVQQLGYKL